MSVSFPCLLQVPEIMNLYEGVFNLAHSFRDSMPWLAVPIDFIAVIKIEHHYGNIWYKETGHCMENPEQKK